MDFLLLSLDLNSWEELKCGNVKQGEKKEILIVRQFTWNIKDENLSLNCFKLVDNTVCWAMFSPNCSSVTVFVFRSHNSVNRLAFDALKSEYQTIPLCTVQYWRRPVPVSVQDRRSKWLVGWRKKLGLEEKFYWFQEKKKLYNIIQ